MTETMLTQARICLLFWVLWKSGVGGSGVGGSGVGAKQIIPTEKKPHESEKIFYVETSTESQCLYICNQNKKCLATLYNKLRSLYWV